MLRHGLKRGAQMGRWSAANPRRSGLVAWPSDGDRQHGPLRPPAAPRNQGAARRKLDLVPKVAPKRSSLPKRVHPAAALRGRRGRREGPPPRNRALVHQRRHTDWLCRVLLSLHSHETHETRQRRRTDSTRDSICRQERRRHRATGSRSTTYIAHKPTPKAQRAHCASHERIPTRTLKEARNTPPRPHMISAVAFPMIDCRCRPARRARRLELFCHRHRLRRARAELYLCANSLSKL